MWSIILIGRHCRARPLGVLFQSAHQRAKADKSFRNLAVEYCLQTLYRFVIHGCQAVVDIQRDLVGWRRFRVVDRYQGRMPLAILFREYRPFGKAGILDQAMLRFQPKRRAKRALFVEQFAKSAGVHPVPASSSPSDCDHRLSAPILRLSTLSLTRKAKALLESGLLGYQQPGRLGKCGLRHGLKSIEQCKQPLIRKRNYQSLLVGHFASVETNIMSSGQPSCMNKFSNCS
jgi:hypothetical protein